MNEPEDKDPTWELLKNARKTEVSPVFAQNLLRELRQLDGAPARGLPAWISLRWGAALAGAAALLLGGFFLLNPADPPGAPVSVAADPSAYAEPTPYEEITIEEFAAELDELAYLSTLLDVPDTSLLADEDLAALLF